MRSNTQDNWTNTDHSPPVADTYYLLWKRVRRTQQHSM